ncbi:hypothetical protein V2G26_009914 [Clonostachys chloroleuca]
MIPPLLCFSSDSTSPILLNAHAWFSFWDCISSTVISSTVQPCLGILILRALVLVPLLVRFHDVFAAYSGSSGVSWYGMSLIWLEWAAVVFCSTELFTYAQYTYSYIPPFSYSPEFIIGRP